MARRENGRGKGWGLEGGAGPGGRGGASRHPTDERLDHEGVLEVADGVAVLGPSLVDPWERTEKSQ